MTGFADPSPRVEGGKRNRAVSSMWLRFGGAFRKSVPGRNPDGLAPKKKACG